MKDLITINPKKITLWVDESGKFLFKKEAENELVKLLGAQKMIEEAIENVKTTIETAGKSISPNFKGVRGHRIDCTVRKYGSKYNYDSKLKDSLDKFLSLSARYSVNTSKVEEYLKDKGKLPEGITENDRPDTVTITWREDEQIEA